ncbi:hypothetical protein A2U01_0064766, partial [Trifolium medium]|nr:hypothetical protein [Trifolium medium]
RFEIHNAKEVLLTNDAAGDVKSENHDGGSCSGSTNQRSDRWERWRKRRAAQQDRGTIVNQPTAEKDAAFK